MLQSLKQNAYPQNPYFPQTCPQKIPPIPQAIDSLLYLLPTHSSINKLDQSLLLWVSNVKSSLSQALLSLESNSPSPPPHLLTLYRKLLSSYLKISFYQKLLSSPWTPHGIEKIVEYYALDLSRFISSTNFISNLGPAPPSSSPQTSDHEEQWDLVDDIFVPEKPSNTLADEKNLAYSKLPFYSSTCLEFLEHSNWLINFKSKELNESINDFLSDPKYPKTDPDFVTLLYNRIFTKSLAFFQAIAKFSSLTLNITTPQNLKSPKNSPANNQKPFFSIVEKVNLLNFQLICFFKTCENILPNSNTPQPNDIHLIKDQFIKTQSLAQNVKESLINILKNKDLSPILTQIFFQNTSTDSLPSQKQINLLVSSYSNLSTTLNEKNISNNHTSKPNYSPDIPNINTPNSLQNYLKSANPSYTKHEDSTLEYDSKFNSSIKTNSTGTIDFNNYPESKNTSILSSDTQSFNDKFSVLSLDKSNASNNLNVLGIFGSSRKKHPKKHPVDLSIKTDVSYEYKNEYLNQATLTNDPLSKVQSSLSCNTPTLLETSVLNNTSSFSSDYHYKNNSISRKSKLSITDLSSLGKIHKYSNPEKKYLKNSDSLVPLTKSSSFVFDSKKRMSIINQDEINDYIFASHEEQENKFKSWFSLLTKKSSYYNINSAITKSQNTDEQDIVSFPTLFSDDISAKQSSPSYNFAKKPLPNTNLNKKKSTNISTPLQSHYLAQDKKKVELDPYEMRRTFLRGSNNSAGVRRNSFTSSYLPDKLSKRKSTNNYVTTPMAKTPIKAENNEVYTIKNLPIIPTNNKPTIENYIEYNTETIVSGSGTDIVNNNSINSSRRSSYDSGISNSEYILINTRKTSQNHKSSSGLSNTRNQSPNFSDFNSDHSPNINSPNSKKSPKLVSALYSSKSGFMNWTNNNQKNSQENQNSPNSNIVEKMQKSLPQIPKPLDNQEIEPISNQKNNLSAIVNNTNPIVPRISKSFSTPNAISYLTKQLKVDLDRTVSSIGYSKNEATPWYLNSDYAEKELIIQNDIVIAGTLRAIVERMTPHNTAVDSKFVHAFLLTFRSFCTPMELLNHLIARFDTQPPKEIVDDPKLVFDWEKKKQLPARLRVYNVFKTWLDSYFYLDEDYECLSDIEKFSYKFLMPTKAVLGARLIQLVRERKLEYDSAINGSMIHITRSKTIDLMFISKFSKLTNLPPPPKHKLSKKVINQLIDQKHINLLEVDPIEFARQLTVSESYLFCSIRPHEFLGQNTNKPLDYSKTSNIVKMSKMSNQLAYWAIIYILSEQNPKTRALIIKFIIKVANECLKLHNYNSLFLLASALNNSCVSRLKKTWSLVSNKYISIYTKIQKIVDPYKNYIYYRNTLSSTNPPALPFLGVILTDLTFNNDGNPNFRKTNSSQIVIKDTEYADLNSQAKDQDQSNFGEIKTNDSGLTLRQEVSIERQNSEYLELSGKTENYNNTDNLDVPIKSLKSSLTDIKYVNSQNRELEGIDISQKNDNFESTKINNKTSKIMYLEKYLHSETAINQEQGDLEEKNTMFKDQSHEEQMPMINFSKYGRTVKIIEHVQKFQVPYNLHLITELVEYLNHSLTQAEEMWNEEKYYQRSLFLEPRNT
ncbi:hypothetical protein BB559_000800 [Furculomyces boomerangus]|uniref:Ras-GEF domain-containing protein n=1 Tax=Furculomyces boomerangus TaxID=61424 RepID=A0A2T9Z3Z6_9FUNG|nr:hypothetical protein BB559_000800 [Furculomyces boomerangus]